MLAADWPGWSRPFATALLQTPTVTVVRDREVDPGPLVLRVELEISPAEKLRFSMAVISSASQSIDLFVGWPTLRNSVVNLQHVFWIFFLLTDVVL